MAKSGCVVRWWPVEADGVTEKSNRAGGGNIHQYVPGGRRLRFSNMKRQGNTQAAQDEGEGEQKLVIVPGTAKENRG